MGTKRVVQRHREKGSKGKEESIILGTACREVPMVLEKTKKLKKMKR